MNEIQKYIAAHEPKMMDDLFSLIRIPSISALPEHHDDMLACAERWAQLLLEAGVDEALVMPSQGNPVVFAQKIVNPDAKTVLIYAHYDVMPAEPLELWKSEPFEPEIRDGHIWARGADDDKGQSFIQVKAFEYLVKNGLLKNNVKFIFEGEEEIGSPSLEAFCEEHKELLKADVILVSDTSMLGAELPSLTTGLRGLAYWEIELIEKLKEGQPFMTTSCCPSYVQLAEKHIPDLKKYISSTGSPMYYTARIVKEKYPDAKIVFVGPCVAKRKEVKLDPCVDFTLTFEEVGSVLEGLGIKIEEAQPFSVLFNAVREAHGFAETGIVR